MDLEVNEAVLREERKLWFDRTRAHDFDLLLKNKTEKKKSEITMELWISIKCNDHSNIFLLKWLKIYL